MLSVSQLCFAHSGVSSVVLKISVAHSTKLSTGKRKPKVGECISRLAARPRGMEQWKGTCKTLSSNKRKGKIWPWEHSEMYRIFSFLRAIALSATHFILPGHQVIWALTVQCKATASYPRITSLLCDDDILAENFESLCNKNRLKRTAIIHRRPTVCQALCRRFSPTSLHLILWRSLQGGRGCAENQHYQAICRRASGGVKIWSKSIGFSSHYPFKFTETLCERQCPELPRTQQGQVETHASWNGVEVSRNQEILGLVLPIHPAVRTAALRNESNYTLLISKSRHCHYISDQCHLPVFQLKSNLLSNEMGVDTASWGQPLKENKPKTHFPLFNRDPWRQSTL